MTILPSSRDVSLASAHSFDAAFSATLRDVIFAVAAEPRDSPADLLAELDCAVTRLVLATLGRQA